MRVVLAGATGTLGSVLVPRLRAAGHTVVGLTRSADRARRLQDAGVQMRVVDVMDEQRLLEALDSCRADAVIHQATAITGMPLRHRDLHATDDLREKGTANLLRAAESVGARRFVTQSFFLGYGYHDHGETALTEDHPFAPPGKGAFERHMRSMRSNERQTFAATGIEGIALRYGLFYGPEPSTRKLMAMAARRMLPMPRPSGITCPIHIADAAAATVAALERGRAGQAYNIVDDNPIPFAGFVAAVAKAANAPAPRTLPDCLLRATPYMHALMVGTRIRLSNEKAKRELGWEPEYPSCHEGLRHVHMAGK
ncbi:NAD-dependent dehydratase [Actinosynnema sp. ALI-1.44]|uniref:NAD-dependent epimerase/dehydratase family protein n=1 Tax=Actinosynnema sp. ALI-1.44 TaxID=1933779 RepID=UPI00097C5CA8|nr:NAD(P)-dependent oxidoreductase [Actinosynnema sp. ALI-1.44]ONI81378.1 NAD-dependent dehydratase [Actinosynnema sp. ALI-1.44]